MPVYRLKNVIHPYAWGSTTAIAELLGHTGPSPHPQAELWMGTHPKGPSEVIVDGTPISLPALIAKNPDGILGPGVSRRFDRRLPFLFKVLAADQPLSIQAHPDKTQACEGFARENQQGKAMDALDRNYRDANHKPEIICALTPFWALNGFRPVKEAIALISPICPDALSSALAQMKQASGEKGIEVFFKAMMSLGAGGLTAACGEILEKVNRLAHAEEPVYAWVTQLAAAYPRDMGVLAPAILNLVYLTPGQALYLPAGQLHAYLKGMGIELMANSDNVLRGGLTPKHMDMPELLRVVRFEPTIVNFLETKAVSSNETRFACPAEEFSLSVIRVGKESPYHSPFQRNVEILLCTEGNGTLVSGTKTHGVQKGDSFLLPADIGSYTIDGELVLYKATVPDHR